MLGYQNKWSRSQTECPQRTAVSSGDPPPPVCPSDLLLTILLSGVRVFGMFRQASDREAVYACFTFSHWLVYANSAANPIIYNFLSGK